MSLNSTGSAQKSSSSLSEGQSFQIGKENGNESRKAVALDGRGERVRESAEKAVADLQPQVAEVTKIPYSFEDGNAEQERKFLADMKELGKKSAGVIKSLKDA
eukprot:8541926-Karenia_brevis.AAC.1